MFNYIQTVTFVYLVYLVSSYHIIIVGCKLIYSAANKTLPPELAIYIFQTVIDCASSDGSLAVSLKLGNQPSAFLYGTNAFPAQGGSELDLSHYAYAGEVCDCATSSAVASGVPCQDG